MNEIERLMSNRSDQAQSMMMRQNAITSGSHDDGPSFNEASLDDKEKLTLDRFD